MNLQLINDFILQEPQKIPSSHVERNRGKSRSSYHEIHNSFPQSLQLPAAINLGLPIISQSTNYYSIFYHCLIRDTVIIITNSGWDPRAFVLSTFQPNNLKLYYLSFHKYDLYYSFLKMIIYNIFRAQCMRKYEQYGQVITEKSNMCLMFIMMFVCQNSGSHNSFRLLTSAP